MTRESLRTDTYGSGFSRMFVILGIGVGVAGLINSCQADSAEATTARTELETKTVFNPDGSALTAVVGEIDRDGGRRFGSFMLSTCEDGDLRLVTAKKVEGVPGVSITEETMPGVPVCAGDDQITPADMAA